MALADPCSFEFEGRIAIVADVIEAAFRLAGIENVLRATLRTDHPDGT
jgi:hypothetical protein